MSEEDQSKGGMLGTVAGGALWSFGGRIAKLTLLFLVEALMARLLGMSSYGGVTLAIVAINIGNIFGSLGLNSGLGRKLPYYEKEEEKARGVIWVAVLGSLAGSTLLGIGLFVGADFIASTVLDDPNVATLLRISAVGIPFSVLVGLGIAIAKSFNDAKTHVIVKQLFIPISRTITVPALIVAIGITGAVAGITATFVLGGLLAMYLGIKQVPFDISGTRAPMAKELVTFSVPLMFASGMGIILGKIDIVLIGVFMASDQVGIYNVAQNIMNLGWLFFYPVTFLLGPVLTRLDRDDRIPEANRIYQVSVKWMTLLTFPLFLLVFLFPEVVIGVTFGRDAISGATAVQLLMIPVMFSVIMGANGGALLSFGHNQIHMYGNAATAAINVVLNLLLIPRFGITGAALATATSLALRNMVYSARLYQCHGVHPFSRALLRSIGTSVPLVVAGYLLFRRLFPVTFFTVTAVGILFLFVYTVIVVKTGGIEQEDIDLVGRFEDNSNVDLDVLRMMFKRLQAV